MDVKMGFNQGILQILYTFNSGKDDQSQKQASRLRPDLRVSEPLHLGPRPHECSLALRAPTRKAFGDGQVA